jgi:cytochrome c biogenesis protein CcdA
VLPLLPVVIGAATTQSRVGLVALAAGMVVAFTAVGVALLASGQLLGVGGDFLRNGAAVLMLLFGLVLLSARLQERFAAATTGMGDAAGSVLDRLQPRGASGQFVTGGLLGIVWTPCVGPTLGAAIALAARGEALSQVSLVMAVFSAFAVLPLLFIGLISRARFQRDRTRLMEFGLRGRRWMGWGLVIVGVLVLTGLDKMLEAWALDVMPDWLIDLTVRF